MLRTAECAESRMGCEMSLRKPPNLFNEWTRRVIEWTQNNTLSEETRRTSVGYGSSMAPRQNVVDIETTVSAEKSVSESVPSRLQGLSSVGEVEKVDEVVDMARIGEIGEIGERADRKGPTANEETMSE